MTICVIGFTVYGIVKPITNNLFYMIDYDIIIEFIIGTNIGHFRKTKNLLYIKLLRDKE